MDIDPTLIVAWLQSGAATVASTLVAEATKDAYQAVKTKVGELFGATAASAVSKLEQKPDDAAAKADLESAIAKLTDDQKTVLAPLLATLAAAFKSDEAARELAREKGHIRLDFDAKGNVTIARVAGANLMDVKARADGDIAFTDIEIDSGPSSGN